MSDSPIKLLDILSLCSISLIMQSSLSSRFPFLVVGLPSIWIVHSSFDLFLPSFISFLFFINISICKVLLVALLIYIYWVFFSQIWRNSRLLLLCVHRPCPALFSTSLCRVLLLSYSEKINHFQTGTSEFDHNSRNKGNGMSWGM